MEGNRLFKLPVSGEKSRDLQGSLTGSFVAKYLVAHYQKLEKLEADLQRLPEEEEFFFLQSDNSFNAFTFIPWILKQKKVKHLYATTYSINKRVIETLAEFHSKGYIDQITLLVSDSLLKRNPSTADLLASMNCHFPNIHILFAWVHAKVALLETQEDYYVIEGSGNWSENAYYEQYLFANSKGLFDFRRQLITEAEIRYKAENGINVKMECHE